MPTIRRLLRIGITFSCAAESVMEQDLGLLIGLQYADQWESFLLFLVQLSLWWNMTWASWLAHCTPTNENPSICFLCSWVGDKTGPEPPDWPDCTPTNENHSICFLCSWVCDGTGPEPHDWPDCTPTNENHSICFLCSWVGDKTGPEPPYWPTERPTSENHSYCFLSSWVCDGTTWALAWTTVRRPMRIIITVSCAAESVKEQDWASWLAHCRPTNENHSICFLWSWVCDGTGPEPPDWPTVRRPMRIIFLFLVQLSL